MKPQPPAEKDSKKSTANNAAKYSGIGFQLLATIALFTWLGYLADQHFHHQIPWITAISSLTGVCIGIYSVIRQAGH